jgi:hypothetical protein
LFWFSDVLQVCTRILEQSIDASKLNAQKEMALAITENGQQSAHFTGEELQ